MYCYQCEQTAGGTGCDKFGVCGKSPEVAALQDLLVHALKGLSIYAVEGRKVGVSDVEANRFTCEAMFATLTNVNFDPERIRALIEEAFRRREELKERVEKAGGKIESRHPIASFQPGTSLEGMVTQGASVGIKSDPGADPNVHSLKWTLIYGLKGISAYADHAAILGVEDDAIYSFI